MNANDWFYLTAIILILRPPIDVVVRALAERIKRGAK